MDDINVIFCPYCGDSWEPEDSSYLNKACLCYKCYHIYKPDKIWTMWRFVYNCLKRTKM